LEEINSLKLSNDLNHNAAASRAASSQDGLPSSPESVILEEHSPQVNNDMAIVDSHLPAKRSVCTIEDNLQHALPAPQTSLTYETDLAVSVADLATPPEGVTGLANSFILGSSPEADTQREGLNQTCLPVARTPPVSPADPTDSTFTPKARGHAHESQQNPLDKPDQPALVISANCHALHDSMI
jgi:hypothetical protein